MSTPQPTASLLGLPAELRVQIYDSVVRALSPVTILINDPHFKYSGCSRKDIALKHTLLQVSKQIRSEALPLIADGTPFYVRIDYRVQRDRTVSDWAQGLYESALLRDVRKVYLDVGVFLRSSGPWFMNYRRLFRQLLQIFAANNAKEIALIWDRQVLTDGPFGNEHRIENAFKPELSSLRAGGTRVEVVQVPSMLDYVEPERYRTRPGTRDIEPTASAASQT